VQRERERLQFGGALEAVHGQQRLVGRRGDEGHVLKLPPIIMRMMSSRVRPATGLSADLLAVAHHRHAVGNLEDLLEAVRDIDDADALVLSGRGSA